MFCRMIARSLGTSSADVVQMVAVEQAPPMVLAWRRSKTRAGRSQVVSRSFEGCAEPNFRRADFEEMQSRRRRKGWRSGW